MTRVNPLVLLSVGGFSFFGSFFVRDIRTAVIALAAYAVAGLLLLPGWRFPLVCLAFSLLGSVTVVYSTWRLGSGGLEPAITQGLRLIVLAWPGSVAIGYLDPARLGDHLAQSLRLPARPVAAFSASLQRFASFGHAWTQLERVRRVRGLGTTRNPLANLRWIRGMSFALLVHAMRGASRSSIAMDARGFATAHDRSWAEAARWTRLDIAATVGAAVLGAVPLVVLLST
ncbi:energy-coupling factor transporter transmembrane component T [Aeromicrobium sp.]|uniref:energy-coupling factor transporter transmembrane component T family protein n=1 Tax=Aeromicrobium sp. TaxID=1871063 RepID=UPI0030BEAE93